MHLCIISVLVAEQRGSFSWSCAHTSLASRDVDDTTHAGRGSNAAGAAAAAACSALNRVSIYFAVEIRTTRGTGFSSLATRRVLAVNSTYVGWAGASECSSTRTYISYKRTRTPYRRVHIIHDVCIISYIRVRAAVPLGHVVTFVCDLERRLFGQH